MLIFSQSTVLNSLKKGLLDTEPNAAREVRTLGGYQTLRLNSLAMQSTHPAWCIFTLRRVLADEKWLVLRTSIGCINKREGSQATRDDSGKGISIHLSQRSHLLAGFATNPSHRNCIWEKMPRGMRGDIFFGPQGGSKGFCYCNNCYY